MTKLLQEVREADASPGILAIYNDICNTLGVPFVNLIHRYLATIPGALEYAWALGRDACLDGRLDSWVTTMMVQARLDEIPVTADVALPNHAREIAARIVEIYNRQNPRNVIVFTALLRVLRDPELQPSEAIPSLLASTERRVPATTVPPLPKFVDLDEHTQQLLLELAALQRLEGTGLIPSLYLHLASVPGAVSATYDAIIGPLRDGTILERVEHVRAGASIAAQRLGPQERTAPASVYARRAEIADVVASFTERAIPSMAVIGNILARRLQ